MNKLDAVNMVLEANGIRPVSALDTNGASEAAMAERSIDAVDLSQQLPGYRYNTRGDTYTATLSPNAESKIPVPTGTLKIWVSGGSAGLNIYQIGAFLFDGDNNTDTFTTSVDVEYTLRYDFNCIPLHVQIFMAWEAAWNFHNKWRPEERFRTGYILGERNKAKADCEQAEVDIGQANIFHTEEHLRIRGYRRPRPRSGY